MPIPISWDTAENLHSPERAPVTLAMNRQTPHRDPSGRDFGHLNIAVLAENSPGIDTLIRELQRTRARVTHIWPPPASYPIDYDVIFSELVEDLPGRLPWTPGEPSCALIVLLEDDRSLNAPTLRNCTPHGFVSLPVRPNDLVAALVIGLSQFQYEKRLRSRIDKLDDYIRAIRSVERAKNVIMVRKQLNEDEAYHFLRRQAMARRISIGELALAIVDTDEMLT
jgi:AmiR/NasT family two-component response regulator